MKVTDFFNPETNPIPEEMQQLIQLFLEGRVATWALAVEIKADSENTYGWLLDWDVNVDDHESDAAGLIGYLEILKREVMRSEIPSQVEYLSFDDLIDGEDSDGDGNGDEGWDDDYDN